MDQSSFEQVDMNHMHWLTRRHSCVAGDHHVRQVRREDRKGASSRSRAIPFYNSALPG